MHLLILFWNKEKLHGEWKEEITVAIYKRGDKPDCGNYRVISLLSTKHKIYHHTVKVNSIYRENNCGSLAWISTQEVNCRLCILHSSNIEKQLEYSEAVHKLFMDFKTAYNSVTSEVLCNIFTEVVFHETGKDNEYVNLMCG